MTRFAGRPLDKLWYTFFLLHIPTSLLLDLQLFYPPFLLETLGLGKLTEWYTAFSRDPIILGALDKGNPGWGWIRCFLALEGLFQLPMFAIGAWCLRRNDKRVYPLLLAYGASTATTLLPVLHALLTVHPKPPLNVFELSVLLSSYIPFLLIPLGMTIDMGMRILSIISTDNARKTR